jgi:monoamine oxidase
MSKLQYLRPSYRSHLTKMFREAQAICAEARATGMPIDEVTEIRADRSKKARETRREFLEIVGKAAAVVAASSFMPLRMRAQGKLGKVVIVGGGVAGLRCAHRLWTKWGRASTVYEWDDHVGGRIDTFYNFNQRLPGSPTFFANGQYAELHGEFVSSEHSEMIGLANRYGLQLDIASTSQSTPAFPPGTVDVYWFNGGYYTQAELAADWQKFGWALFNNAVLTVPFAPCYNCKNSATGVAWDNMSVPDWVNKYVPGGMSAPFGKLCYQDVISEYGGPPEKQSSLNLLYILGYFDSATSGRGFQPENYPYLAGTDEKYHIHGGNYQIINGMANELPAGTIHLGQQLVAVALNADGTYTCTFQNTSGTLNEVTDIEHLVLAIPFSTLRKVDLSKANLSSLKTYAINNYNLGNNTKTLVQFNTRYWNTLGYDGNLYGDTTAINWDNTSYQPGSPTGWGGAGIPQGIMVNFQGGVNGQNLAANYGLTQDTEVAPTKLVNDTLAMWEPVWPGISGQYNGKAIVADGNIDPHLLGAYSQYSLGQYTTIRGIEGVQEGNIHFCNEGTSLNFQGFMEGGATEGVRVADTEIKNV